VARADDSASLALQPHPRAAPPPTRPPKTYPHKGRVVGLYYGADGAPTPALAAAEAAAAEGERLKAEKAEEERKYIACSMKYTAAEGGGDGCRGMNWGWVSRGGRAGEEVHRLQHEVHGGGRWGGQRG
jgi:hypothetical protein